MFLNKNVMNKKYTGNPGTKYQPFCFGITPVNRVFDGVFYQYQSVYSYICDSRVTSKQNYGGIDEV